VCGWFVVVCWLKGKMRCLVYREAEAEAGRAEGYGWLGEGKSGNGGGCGFSCLAKWGGAAGLGFFFFSREEAAASGNDF